jgi:hypothetical protein
VETRRSVWLTALVAVVGGLAAVASGAGVFLRGDLATRTFTTVRGDEVQVLIGGIYRFNGVNVASEGVGWDLVTLFLVVPALALALPFLWKGSLRATLAATGILVYLLYQFFEYATFLAYGPLFLVYVAIAGLSLTAIPLLLATIDLPALPAMVGPGFPRRGMTAFGIYMAVLLGGLWLSLIAATFNADRVRELYGSTTLVVQAFDLGLLVPLGLFTAATVFRRHVAGFVLAAVVVVKGVTMGTAIAAMLVVEYLVTGELQPVPIAIFALTALVSAVLGWRVYGSLPAGRRATGVRMAHAGEVQPA